MKTPTVFPCRWIVGLSPSAKIDFLRLLLGSALCCLATPVVHGASLYWTGAINGYWSEPGNWDPSIIPQNGDNVFFVRDNDAHRVMVNDLVNLTIRYMHFGVFTGDSSSNDHDYELNGNTLSFSASDASIHSDPYGSSTVTINCPLVFQDGGVIGTTSRSINPLFQETARLVINGPLAVNAGVLRLEPSGTYLFANQDGRLVLAGSLSGAGDVRVDPFSFSSVEFIGPANNTLSGTMYLSTEDGGEIIFNKTAGYVVTNVLSVVSRGEATLKLNLANQFGPNSTILLTQDAILHLSGTSQLVGNLVFTNNLLPTASPPILDTGNTTCMLRNGITSRVTLGGNPPIIQGSLSLTAGNHNFNVEANVYAGFEIQAEIIGPGGFTKTGGAALLLKGANTFIGNVTAAEGIVDAHTSSAFGATSGGVTLDGGSVTLRNLTISGETLFAQGQEQVTIDTGGSLLFSVGAATWTGSIQLDTNLVVSGGDMFLTGPITGAGGLDFRTFGTAQLGGGAANTYTGTTLVRCPLVEFNKPYDVKAFSGPLIVGGPLAGPSEARWLNYYQGAGGPLTLYANGFVYLTNNTERFSSITFNGGQIDSGPFGMCVLGSPFNTNASFLTVNAATTPAVINGYFQPAGGSAWITVANGLADPDLLINANVVGFGPQIIKQGPGTLRLAGGGNYTAETLVNEGILDVANTAALGSVNYATIVSAGATLQLSTFSTVPESFALSGTGVGGTDGAIHATGNPTVTGSIFLNGPATINVAPGASLAVDNRIGGTGPLTKTGAGNLFLGGVSGGTGNNTYSGSTIVTAGTLYLSKNQNVISVPGPLVVGSATVASPATARFSRTGTMVPAGTVTVNANSLLDLNDNGQTLAQLNLNDGGDVQTGTGQLNFAAGGVVTVGTLNAPQVGLLASSSISGKVGLPALDNLTFNVGGYGAAPLGPDAELVIPALISGGGNIIKNGAGTMLLSGANTFNDSPPNVAGDLYIYGGIVIAASSGALGGTGGWTLVYNGARLALVGNITIANETLYLNSTNTTTLDNPGGTNIWTGPITLARDSSIGVNLDWSLTTSGVISGSGSLTKLGAGTLWLAGSANNTYVGDTFVNEGSLELAKAANIQAVPANLIIGRPAGGTSAIGRHANTDQIWGAVTVNNGGLLDVNGYTEFIGNLTLNGGGDVQTGAGILHASTNLSVNPGSFADQSVISGRLGLNPGTVQFTVNPGSLGPGVADCLVSAIISPSSHVAGFQKNGAGRLQLTANNTYSGNTTVTAGTVQIDGLQPQSPVQVFGGRLQGSGTVGHVVFDETKCFLAPGSSPGTLTTSNLNTTALGGAKVEIELNGLSAGSGYDQINVRGTVNLSQLSLVTSLGFASSAGQQFTIINNDGADAVSGTFSSLPQNAQLSVGGELFQINYSGGTGNDVVLTRLVTPPRPILLIERISPAFVRLVWPTNNSSFNLQSTPNLNPANWTLASTPTVVGTNNLVTNAVSGTQKFYRLVSL